VHDVNDVKKTETHTTESLVPGFTAFEVEVVIEELKWYKLLRSDQIPTELTQAGSETLCSENYRIINYVWTKGKLSQQRKNLYS
jgi:hypothetical protein